MNFDSKIIDFVLKQWWFLYSDIHRRGAFLHHASGGGGACAKACARVARSGRCQAIHVVSLQETVQATDDGLWRSSSRAYGGTSLWHSVWKWWHLYQRIEELCIQNEENDGSISIVQKIFLPDVLRPHLCPDKWACTNLAYQSRGMYINLSWRMCWSRWMLWWLTSVGLGELQRLL